MPDETPKNIILQPTAKLTGAPAYAQLSPNQELCLTAMMNGKSDQQIADKLGISLNSVQKHFTAAAQKFRTMDKIADDMSAYVGREQFKKLLINHGFYEPVPQA